MFHIACKRLFNTIYTQHFNHCADIHISLPFSTITIVVLLPVFYLGHYLMTVSDLAIHAYNNDVN